MARRYPEIVLNTSSAVDSACRFIQGVFDNQTVKHGVLYQLMLKPYGAPKTFKQLATIKVLCNTLAVNKEEEWSGHSPDFWYRFYKLRAYIPQLEAQALEDDDEYLVELIAKARKLIKLSRAGRFMVIEDDGEDYGIDDFIADNPAFSYADAKKEHLIEVIDYMLKDSAKKGIYLEIKNKDEE